MEDQDNSNYTSPISSRSVKVQIKNKPVKKSKSVISEKYSNDYDDDDDGAPKSKLRKRNPETWKQNVRKRNKNQGLEYVKANGEICEKKKLGPPCNCKEKCYARIGTKACEKIFQNFWKLGDHSLQNAYIAGCVRIYLPKNCNKKDGTPGRRFFSRAFYVNVNGVDTDVCKQAFLNIHAISNGRLDRLLKKKQEIGNTGFDERGRHNNKVNKIPIEKILLVRKHIDSVRKKAGFTGKRKSKKVEILPGLLNIRTMYRSYKEEILRLGLEPVCEYRYRKIFHTDFHLEFGKTPVQNSSKSEAKQVAQQQQQQQPQQQQLLQQQQQQQEQPCEQESEHVPTEHIIQPVQLQEKQIYKMPIKTARRMETCSNVTFQDMNINLQMNPTFKTYKQIPIYSQYEIQDAKEYIERPPETTFYVHSQEVFRLDCSSGYFCPQQNWIFPTIN